MIGNKAERIYVDSNVFIYTLEGPDEIKAAIAPVLIKLRVTPGLGVTSELTLAEVLAKPERDGPTILVRAYIDLLIWSRTIALQPVSRDILIESANYRAVPLARMPAQREDRRNFLPDAIHVVTAIRCDCTAFVGKDARIRLPSGMRRIHPDAAGLEGFMSTLP